MYGRIGELAEARQFAEAIHAKYPGPLLSYNCSPSFNWKRNLSDSQIARFQQDLRALGYKFQFVTLSGFHSLNYGMFELASAYRERGMAAYSELQEREFAAEARGYEAVKHQRKKAFRAAACCRHSWGANVQARPSLQG